MTKTLSMISYKSYSPNVDEGFVIFSTSKLISCLIDNFTSKMKSQLLAYLLNGSEHIYILDFGPWKWSALNMGYIMDKRPSRTQGQFYFPKSDKASNSFWSGSKILDLFCGGCPEMLGHGPWPLSSSPRKVRRGRYIIRPQPQSSNHEKPKHSLQNPRHPNFLTS